MRRRVVYTWAIGNDPNGVDSWMASIVMPLDVLHVHRGTHSMELENVFCVIEQIRVLP